MDEKTLERERSREFKLSPIDRVRYRTPYFSDSGIIGAKDFVKKHCRQFRHIFQSKREKIPKRIPGLDGVYSQKRLTESSV